MSFWRRCGAALVACALVLVPFAAAAAGLGSFGVPKPPAAEPGGFDAPKKPAVPVSFLAHDRTWVQFFYPPSARDRVAPLIAQSDDLRAELAEDLGQTPLDAIEVRVARSLEEMSSLAPQSSPPAPQATSESYPKLKLIVLSLGSSVPTEPSELRGGFRRELARLALSEAVLTGKIPAWLGEGFVRHFSREGEWDRAWVLYRAFLRQNVYAVTELDSALQKKGPEAELGAAEAADFTGFLLKPEMRAHFAPAIERLRQGDSFESAVALAYGLDLPLLERHWTAERRRWTTLTTVSFAIGSPALFAMGWGILRAARRRHRRRVEGNASRGTKEQRAGSAAERARVHIVLSRRDERLEPPVIAEPEIPKVEHEGEWHTLH